MALKIQEKNNKQNLKIYDFKNFSGPSFPITYSFRQNIRSFIQENAQECCTDEEGVKIWITCLENNGVKIPLYTIEESIQHSYKPYCRICSYTGWSVHLVSKRRYRLIIPNSDKWDKQLPSVVDLDNDSTYLLHGVIHCNGFGHLLCISGNQEKGSKHLCGYEVMDLWDRLCTNLGTRSISVKDMSNIKGAGTMSLGLLYGVANGQSRFAKWNYRFHNGAYGLDLKRFEAAIRTLGAINLNEVVENMAIKDNSDSRKINVLIGKYRLWNRVNMITLRDLLKFMISLLKAATDRHANLEASNYSLDRLLSASEDVNSVRHDIAYLCEHVSRSYLKKPAFVILRNNYFVKEWKIKDEGDKVLKFMCPVRLFLSPTYYGDRLISKLPQSLELGELVVLPLNATIGDLKVAAENCYRDTYFVMGTFQVTGVEGLNHLEDGVLVREHMKSGGQLWLQGTEIQHTVRFLYQGFQLVNCICGAKAQDGQKMQECDICHYWMHRRCKSEKYRYLSICKNCA
ncbi:hypothetical protein AQUCO_00400675v1 [Aquilegia coerulea]|uniref:PHD finger protein MALE STERILITY 1-like ubiquitin-like domain-containing protein n=1 Tax=Aquilegia coerulea TaxID=218851 RepID=A0A2G5EW55_AQUCA|nr:hypothetical protein AQUCO_00400675v1 [Aquilegia coerulea]